MDSAIENIYNLLHAPILTPYNLLENVKLDNYKYVNYSMDHNGIVCEMKCMMENDEVVFHYHFDQRDYLEKVYMSEMEGVKRLVFERNTELEKELMDYKAKSNNLSDAI